MSGGRTHRWLLAVVAVVALLAGGVVAVAGSGDESDRSKPRGRDLTALLCPVVPTTDAQGVERYTPAANAFDTAELVGKRLAEARATAAAHGCQIVVASRDGKGLPVSIEIDPTTIYVFVERGVVSYIEGVGGGL